MVRVFDPSAPEKTPGGGRVYVTNLNEVLSKGRAPARPMSREAFETAALAAHPTGESSPLAAQTMRPVPIPAADGGAAPAPAAADGRGAARGHDLRNVVVRRLPGRAPVLHQPQDSVRRQGRRTRRRRGPRAGGQGRQDGDSDRPRARHRRARPAAARLRSRRASRRCWESPHDEARLRSLGAALLGGARAAGGGGGAHRSICTWAGTPAAMFGWGTTANTQDMFRQRGGPRHRRRGRPQAAGLRLLRQRVRRSSRTATSATLIQGLVGMDVDLPAGNTKLPNGAERAHHPHRGAGSASCSGPTTSPWRRSTNDQLADKGFTSRYRLAYEYFLNPFMGVGGEGQFGYHYLVGGAGRSTTAPTTRPATTSWRWGASSSTSVVSGRARASRVQRPPCRQFGGSAATSFSRNRSAWAGRRRRAWRGSFPRARRRGPPAASRRRSGG